MRDDIVERLREEARFGWHLAANRQDDTRFLHAEAYREIERLRRENDDLKEMMRGVSKQLSAMAGPTPQKDDK